MSLETVSENLNYSVLPRDRRVFGITRKELEKYLCLKNVRVRGEDGFDAFGTLYCTWFSKGGYYIDQVNRPLKTNDILTIDKKDYRLCD